MGELHTKIDDTKSVSYLKCKKFPNALKFLRQCFFFLLISSYWRALNTLISSTFNQHTPGTLCTLVTDNVRTAMTWFHRNTLQYTDTYSTRINYEIKSHI